MNNEENDRMVYVQLGHDIICSGGISIEDVVMTRAARSVILRIFSFVPV